METKYIRVSEELRKKLMRDFKIKNKTTLVNYLYFRRNSDQAKMIREAALQGGGKLIEKTEKEIACPTKRVVMLDNKGNVKAVKTLER
jgi:hypothetical protein